MKKQIVALSCALALGAAGAAWTPASGPSVDATAQIGYALARAASDSDAAAVAASSAGAAIGGKKGERAGRVWGRGLRVVRGVGARTAIVRATVAGARAGASLGAFGGAAGLVVGAALGAL